MIDRRRALLGAVGSLPIALSSDAVATPPKADHSVGQIDVTAFMTAEMRDDVRRGLVKVDCAPAFQAAIDAASARNASTLTTGCRLCVPGGRYLISSPLRFVWRDEQSIADDGDMRRLTIDGHGSSNVVLFYNGNADEPAFEVRGHKTSPGEGTSLRLIISGLRFRRHPNMRGTGTGLRFDGVEGIMLRDVEVSMFDTNIDLVDTLRFTAQESWILGGKIGLRARGDRFSNPNIYSFTNCNLSGNAEIAASFDSGCNITFRSCSFEGNGTNGDIGACVLLHNGPSQGGAAAHLDSCYFENNLVSAEVLADWNTKDGGTVKLTSCTFQRASEARASTHILLRSTAAPLLAHIDACAFKSFGSYRASRARPTISTFGAMVDVTFTACYFQNALEKPLTLRQKGG